MCNSFTLPCPIPKAANPAIRIVHDLELNGKTALLAGGCVRDLLLGNEPADYDVATDATPDEVCQVFRRTRKVGAQFGVVLVRVGGSWIEVATFRSDGEYLDGRRPSEVHFCDAEHDAQRRDFTVNGMFLDPLRRQVIDYVGGRDDLDARLIRAIGDPAARFAEDHLRLVRAVRFAARLGFEIEQNTQAALTACAAKLAGVASERVRQELAKMLEHPTRARAFDLLVQCKLLAHLWDNSSWSDAQIAAARDRIARLSDPVSFPLALAVLLADRSVEAVQSICRALTCSNDQRETVAWLVQNQASLDQPDDLSLAALKLLLAHPAFGELRTWSEMRHAAMPDGEQRRAALNQRLAEIPSNEIKPRPLITGDDLAAEGVEPGPVYKRILDELYTRQLNKTLCSRNDALQTMRDLLAAE